MQLVPEVSLSPSSQIQVLPEVMTKVREEEVADQGSVELGIKVLEKPRPAFIRVATRCEEDREEAKGEMHLIMRVCPCNTSPLQTSFSSLLRGIFSTVSSTITLTMGMLIIVSAEEKKNLISALLTFNIVELLYISRWWSADIAALAIDEVKGPYHKYLLIRSFRRFYGFRKCRRSATLEIVAGGI
jgi:hypothetical protein